jgi:hypothetical protein
MFLNEVDYTINAVSFKSAIGFGVYNPIALKGVEGL